VAAAAASWSSRLEQPAGKKFIEAMNLDGFTLPPKLQLAL
jgi:hypothetical protein